MTVDPAGMVELVLGTMSAGPWPPDELRSGCQRIAGSRAGTSQARYRRHRPRTGQRRRGLGTFDAARVLGDGRRHRSRWCRKDAASRPPCRSVGSGCRFSFFFVVKGTDRSNPPGRGRRPCLGRCRSGGTAPEPTGVADQVMSVPSYAYTSAVCEVEIDPETGTSFGCRLHLDRQLRPGSEPDADPRPKPWRHRARHRTGAIGITSMIATPLQLLSGVIDCLRCAPGRSTLPLFPEPR